MEQPPYIMKQAVAVRELTSLPSPLGGGWGGHKRIGGILSNAVTRILVESDARQSDRQKPNRSQSKRFSK